LQAGLGPGEKEADGRTLGFGDRRIEAETSAEFGDVKEILIRGGYWNLVREN